MISNVSQAFRAAYTSVAFHPAFDLQGQNPSQRPVTYSAMFSATDSNFPKLRPYSQVRDAEHDNGLHFNSPDNLKAQIRGQGTVYQILF